MGNSIRDIQDEQYYRLVANYINDLVALYTPAGILEYVSPSILKLLGYEAEQFTGANPMPAVHPDDRHLLLTDKLMQTTGQQEVVTFEYRLLHKDGHWVYFESYRQPIFNDKNELTNILAVCRDISARKKAEQALLESEELYRMLADNIMDMVVLLRPDGTRMYVSPSSFSLFGYTPEELTGRHFSDIAHPDDVNIIEDDVLTKAMAGQDRFTTEIRIRHKNGHWRYCETVLKALRGNAGNLTAFVATTRDITEWKLAQAALQESEEKYRSLVESSDAMIAIVNRQGKFTFVNDKRADFFGEEKQNIIGKTASDFYDEDKAVIFNERVQKVFEEKKKRVYEYQTNYGNKEHWMRASLMPVFNPAGDVNLVMVSTIDITSIKFSEDALRKQNDTLKQIAFLQSHIVRSPLTNIQGLLFLLNEDGMDDENRFYFRLLKQAAEKLDEIVKEIVEKAIEIRHQTMEQE